MKRTQTYIAEVMDVSPSFVGKMLKGVKNTSVRRAKAILAMLGGTIETWTMSEYAHERMGLFETWKNNDK